MSYKCQILADSTDYNGRHRLTTFQVTFPRFILPEFNTHRMLSKNSASSRAIPTEKIMAQVRDDPFIPRFNRRVKGMGVGEPLDDHEQAGAELWWMTARGHALNAAQRLMHIDKSRVNRLLEPFNWHTVIVSGTDWSNFFALRTDKAAQPEFRTIALMMQEVYREHEPTPLTSSEWHLPLVHLDEIEDDALGYPEPFTDYELWRKVSIARCARVSYLTHDGKLDLEADLRLYDRLLDSRHLSPFEHVARPFTREEWHHIHVAQDALAAQCSLSDDDSICRRLEYHGNYHGWHQARADVPYEGDAAIFTPPKDA